MIELLTIAGGVALLLFGVRYLRRGLDRLFGPRLGTWMSRLSSSPRTSFLSGLAVSVLAPSSTTVSLLAVQTVRAGQMSPRQMLAVMLGANIGLTVMVQLLALRADAMAPILILFGVIFYQYTRSSRLRGIGQVLLSLGFIFLAMSVIRLAVRDGDLASNDDFVQVMQIAGGYPLLLALIVALLTLLLQSSTATLGLVMGLGTAEALGTDGTSTGFLTPTMIVAAVVGANLGMSVTTLLVGWVQVESRRLAWGNLLLKIAVAALALLVVVIAGARLTVPEPDVLPLVVANLHTAFNVVLALAGLPLVGAMSELMDRLVPEPIGARRPFGPKFIAGGPIGSMALSLGQSLREIIHVAEIVRGMLDDVWKSLRTDNERLAEAVSARDDQVDALDAAIKRFLTQLVREEADQNDADEQMRQLRYLSELETIGDIIDKNLVELVLKKVRLGAQFSEEGTHELDEFYEKVVENFEIAVTAFTTRDQALAQQLMRHKERLNAFEAELRDRHFRRLNAGMSEALETSAIHLDMLTHLKRINSAVTHVAYATLHESPPAPERNT